MKPFNGFQGYLFGNELDTEVLEVELSQQETTWPREGRGLTMFRLDFKAIIREADGEKKTVLIELQKSKFLWPLRLTAM